MHGPQVQPWAYQYKKLVLDPARMVRAEANAAMGLLAVALGKGLAPHLKGLMGPWFLAGACGRMPGHCLRSHACRQQ